MTKMGAALVVWRCVGGGGGVPLYYRKGASATARPLAHCCGFGRRRAVQSRAGQGGGGARGPPTPRRVTCGLSRVRRCGRHRQHNTRKEKRVKSRQAAPGALRKRVCGREYKKCAPCAGGRRHHSPRHRHLIEGRPSPPPHAKCEGPCWGGCGFVLGFVVPCFCSGGGRRLRLDILNGCTAGLSALGSRENPNNVGEGGLKIKLCFRFCGTFEFSC